MRKFTFLQTIPLSFHSAELYRDVARSWQAAAFGYLLFLVAVAAVPTGFKAHAGWVEYADNQGAAIVAQVPGILIRNGVATVRAQQPYTIRDPDSGDSIAILDTTGEITDLGEGGARVLLTRDRLIMKKDARETRIYELSAVDHFELDRERAEGWLGLARNLMIVAVFPFIVVGSYVFHLVQVLLYGLIGMLFARAASARLVYASLLALAAVALTPAILLGMALGLLSIDLPYQWLILLAVSLYYLRHGVMSNAAGPPQDQSPSPAPID